MVVYNSKVQHVSRVTPRFVTNNCNLLNISRENANGRRKTRAATGTIFRNFNSYKETREYLRTIKISPLPPATVIRIRVRFLWEVATLETEISTHSRFTKTKANKMWHHEKKTLHSRFELSTATLVFPSDLHLGARVTWPLQAFSALPLGERDLSRACPLRRATLRPKTATQ